MVVSLFIVKSKQALQSHTGQLYSGRALMRKVANGKGQFPLLPGWAVGRGRVTSLSPESNGVRNGLHKPFPCVDRDSSQTQCRAWSFTPSSFRCAPHETGRGSAGGGGGALRRRTAAGTNECSGSGPASPARPFPGLQTPPRPILAPHRTLPATSGSSGSSTRCSP